MNLALANLRYVGIVTFLLGCALGLRWATAETLGQASTTDLVSLVTVVLAGVAWTAYGWLVVVVAATLLGQLPGTVGHVAAIVAVGVTSEASRRLLRSALGVAAAAPLTVGVAHAAPAMYDAHDATRVVQANPSPPIDLTPTDPQTAFSQRSWASIEEPSTVDLTRPARAPRIVRQVNPVRVRAQDRPSSPDTTVGNRDWAPVERPSTVTLVSARRTDADRIPVPDRPTTGRRIRYTEISSARQPRSQPNTKPPVRIVVHRGDSLWTIAARELGPDATYAAIAARWPRWYAANARAIGANPNLLVPGQVLHAPEPSRAKHRLPTSRVNQEN